MTYNCRQKRAIAGAFVLAISLGAAIPFMTSCGSCNGADPLTEAQIARYETLEACTGYQAVYPTIRYREVRPCPTSGRRCCFGHEFRCPDNRDTNSDGQPDMCAIAGQYSECDVIQLRDPVQADEDCGDAFPHEAIHHLLLHNTGDSDAGHKSPFFRECA